MICLGTLPLRNPGILTWFAIDSVGRVELLRVLVGGISTVSLTVCFSVVSTVVCMGAARLPEIVACGVGRGRTFAWLDSLAAVFEHELAFANGLADGPATSAWGSSSATVSRSGARPTARVVTQADTSIEAMVREQVAAAFPDDHVLGEEEGGGDRATGRVWIVDPIDATANFARGIQIWATLIALQVDGELVLGLVNAPALGERYEAVRGGGARMNGAPIRVSSMGALDEAQRLLRRAGGLARTEPQHDGCARLARARRPAPAGSATSGGTRWSRAARAR